MSKVHQHTSILAVALLASLLLGALSGCEPRVNRERDVHGFSALHHAVMRDEEETVLHLLKEKQANPNVADSDGVTPLHRAARDGKFSIARTLLEYRADPTIRTREGWDAVHLAAWKGHRSTVELALSFRGIPNRTTPEGWTGLHLAAMKGHADVMDVILRDWKANETHGKPEIDARDKEGLTPLHWAIRLNHTEAAQYLLAKGASATLPTSAGETPLHLCVAHGNVPLAQSLILHGANPLEPGPGGKSAYEVAVAENQAALAQAMAAMAGRQTP